MKPNATAHAVFGLLMLFGATTLQAQSRTVLMEADFSTYQNGNLAGQNGWVQYGAIGTEPLQIQDGKLILKGGLNALHQTVIWPLANTIIIPASGLVKFEVDMAVRPTSDLTPSSVNDPLTNYFVGFQRDNSTAFDQDNTPIALGGIRYSSVGGNTYATMSRLSESVGHPVGFLQGVSNSNNFALRLTYTMSVGEANNQSQFGVVYNADRTFHTTPMPTREYFDGNVTYRTDTSGGLHFYSQSGTSAVGTLDPESVGALMLRHTGRENRLSAGFEVTYIRWSVFGQFAVSTPDEESEVATKTMLESAYPNPFNPSTVIGYQLSETGAMRLAVYDVLGREVAVLVNGVMPAGTHSATFDASGLTSGVYLYRLETAGGTLTKRMTLVK